MCATDEPYAADLAGRFRWEVGGWTGSVEIAGHRSHRRDEAARAGEDAGVYDIAGVDDVRDAGEDLKDLGSR